MVSAAKLGLKILAYLFLFICAFIFFYGAAAWVQARNDADELRQIAADMRDNGLAADNLGVSESGDNRAQYIVMVEDPDFLNHNGVDFTTAGAGVATITQSLATRLAFESYQSGYHKIRQIGYALGLETVLTKDEIFTLALNTMHMGRSPTGWIEGFHRASKLHYRQVAADISDEEFIALVAVMIEPSELRLDVPSAKRNERIKRIERLIVGECAPNDHDDIWLEGCAT